MLRSVAYYYIQRTKISVHSMLNSPNTVPRQHTVEQAIGLFLLLHEQVRPLGHLTLKVRRVLLHNGHHIVEYVRLSATGGSTQMERWIHGIPSHQSVTILTSKVNVPSREIQPTLSNLCLFFLFASFPFMAILMGDIYQDRPLLG